MSEDTRVEAARQYAELASPEARQHLTGVIDAYDERLRVNMGLLSENTALKRAAENHRCGEEAP